MVSLTFNQKVNPFDPVDLSAGQLGSKFSEAGTLKVAAPAADLDQVYTSDNTLG